MKHGPSIKLVATYPASHILFWYCTFQKFSSRTLGKRKALSIIIAWCGYNQHMKRDDIFGPTKFGGAGFFHLYDQQGIGQIRLFMRQHWRSGSVIDKLLCNLVAWWNHMAGTSVCILENVHTPLHHLELKWLASLRAYMAHLNIWFQLDRTGITPLEERVNDRYIMDVVLASKPFSDV